MAAAVRAAGCLPALCRVPAGESGDTERRLERSGEGAGSSSGRRGAWCRARIPGPSRRAPSHPDPLCDLARALALSGLQDQSGAGGPRPFQFFRSFLSCALGREGPGALAARSAGLLVLSPRGSRWMAASKA